MPATALGISFTLCKAKGGSSPRSSFICFVNRGDDTSEYHSSTDVFGRTGGDCIKATGTAMQRVRHLTGSFAHISDGPRSPLLYLVVGIHSQKEERGPPARHMSKYKECQTTRKDASLFLTLCSFFET